ncbi:MAG: DUF4397 domain-containing protein [Polyangiaceae bacterium]
MRFRSFALLSFLPATVAYLAAGCGGDDSGGFSPSDAFDGSAVGAGGDSSTTAVDAGAAAPALLRFAHLANGLGALDVCYRVGTTDAFTGPLLGPAASALDASISMHDADIDAGDASVVASSGISFPGVSSYFAAPAAGDFEIAIVDAASGSCSTPAARARITLDPGKKLTIAIMGNFEADSDASDALQIVSFVDDGLTIEDAGRSRFIHAALGGHGGNAYQSLSAAAQTATLIPLASEIDPKNAASPNSAPPVVDALGYHADVPIDEGSLRIREITDAAVPSAAWTSTPTLLSLGAGALRTGFIISDKRGIAVLWCDDGSGAAGCTLIR